MSEILLLVSRLIQNKNMLHKTKKKSDNKDTKGDLQLAFVGIKERDINRTNTSQSVCYEHFSNAKKLHLKV